ncbi:MAG: N-acetylmuramoyl-L-alanine amidase [Rhodospirillaceae bacterium]|nr:N-acetylmuramoyl-L-alanine amidase [Rhodospirillaceae bacterium]MDD9917294.1 N-acetylmuramoyl-L-alanine amidase [Rhodospirillaceae bacterium]MDD9927778.1 N-acetylmuramoyl-L-alanine amidase [Rhodospirillaceae bacterium]
MRRTIAPDALKLIPMLPIIESPSPNHGPRPDGTVIDMLVLHYTGMVDAAAALDRLTDPDAEVSAHYLIEEDGTAHRLVAEDRRAWHAGVAAWRGHSNINDRSIGIELVNPGHEFGYRPFPEPQMAALIALATDILARHPITARNVVGHSDVAPTRKEDPGELFDWARLAAAGLGLWPEEGDPDTNVFADRLSRFGYDIADLDAATTAFQRRFRPAQIDGIADSECARRLAGLLALID